MLYSLGLVALACSDMGVCIFLLPMSLTGYYRSDKSPFPATINFYLVYEFFSGFFINMFMIASTLFTTSLAIGRYLAITWPFEMRARMNSKFSISVIVVVVFASITFNVPRFWKKVIQECSFNDSLRYHVNAGKLSDKSIEIYYTCLYFTVAVALPLCVLAFCNIFLIKNLNQPVALDLQQSYLSSCNTLLRKRQEEASRLMTLVLIILVIMHIVLVTPVELLQFVGTVTKFADRKIQTAKTVIAILNLLESINFSFNFILYCAMNSHFRHIVKSFGSRCVHIACKGWRGGKNQGSPSHLVPMDTEMTLLTKNNVHKNNNVIPHRKPVTPHYKVVQIISTL